MYVGKHLVCVYCLLTVHCNCCVVTANPLSVSSDVVGVAVGGALGGFLFGVIVTVVCVAGIYLCYIKCCHGNGG